MSTLYKDSLVLPNKKAQVLQLSIDNISTDDTISWILKNLQTRKFYYVVTPNAQHYVFAQKYEHIASAFNKATLCVNDSHVVAAFLRLFSDNITVVTGADLTQNILRKLNYEHAAITLVGTQRHHLPILQKRYANLTIRHYEPPPSLIKNKTAFNQTMHWIESQPPGLILLALGAPLQELLAQQLLERGRTAGVALCIGASIDYLVGAQKRAPVILQKLCLEWLFRLMNEPNRLWKRYLLFNSQFFVYAVRKLLFSGSILRGWKKKGLGI